MVVLHNPYLLLRISKIQRIAAELHMRIAPCHEDLRSFPAVLLLYIFFRKRKRTI